MRKSASCRARPVCAGTVLAAVACAALFAQTGMAAEIRVSNPTDLKARTAALNAGDTLIVEEGLYSLDYWAIRDISGRSDAWITIKAEGAVHIRGTSTGQNVVDLRNVHYLKLSGFEISSTTSPGTGIDGVKISKPSTGPTGCSYLTFEGLRIHDVSGNGSTIMDDAHHITLRNSRIENCSGCGIYWGYPASYIVHDVLIENNYIHHCPVNAEAAENYGIQFKGDSYRARIVNNVLHDVGGTTRCGIVVYYGKNAAKGDMVADMNIVRGNVLWNCRNEGITAMADAVVENNIVFDAVYGIHVQQYEGNHVENLLVRNNTTFRCGTYNMFIADWGGVGADDNVFLTGNAAYQETAAKKAVRCPSGVGAAVVRGNVYYGVSDLSSGFTAGTGLSDFAAVTAVATAPGVDFYPAPGSPLIDVVKTEGDWADRDFNGVVRPVNGHADAGAYERTGPTNDGWRIEQDLMSAPEPAAPVISDFSVGGQAVSFAWPATVKWIYVDCSSNIAGPGGWRCVTGPIYGAGVELALDGGPREFYRLRMER